MELGLEGSIAVITGGTSGIGLACARSLAKEGCRVAFWYQSAKTTEVAQALGRGAIGIHVDICDFPAIQEAVRQTESGLGPIAHLAHAAAVGSGKFGYPFSKLEPSDWPHILQVNVLGVVHVAHAITPGMIARKAGTMIFLASVAGPIGSQTDPPYSASKAANINFAQCLNGPSNWAT
jgi:2-hydroxycyclohexanecarboxyl-CoA dehydrogenase